jgi:hypothetical protein
LQGFTGALEDSEGFPDSDCPPDQYSELHRDAPYWCGASLFIALFKRAESGLPVKVELRKGF